MADQHAAMMAKIERGVRLESADEMTRDLPRQPRPPHDHAGRLRARGRLRLRAVDHEGARRSRRSTWSRRS